MARGGYRTHRMPDYADVDSPCCDQPGYNDVPCLLWRPAGSPASSPFFCKGCGATYKIVDGKAVPA
jgi:hypothetical protein